MHSSIIKNGDEMNSYYRIGEVAKLFSLNIRTLRYYDSIGLFCPMYQDKRTGYRYYSINQFEELNVIRYLRKMGVPLEKIKHIVKNRNIYDILHIFEEQKTEIRKRKLELELIEKQVDNRINQIIEALNHTFPFEKVTERTLPTRKCVFLKENIQRESNLEMPIRRLENMAKVQDSIFLGKIGLSIAKENLEKEKFDFYDFIFLLLEEADITHETCHTVSEGRYLCIRFRGTHKEAPANYEKLILHCRKEALRIKDNSLEITYVDYGLTQDATQFVTEIQIPVENAYA